MRRALARLRWAGLGVVWDAADPEDAPLQAVAIPAPQVNLTVVRVEAGAHISFGGVSIAPILPAAPQQRAAITTETEEE